MLKFKDYIMPNIGLFFRHKNSIDIFIEDNYDEEFYKALLSRVFQGSSYQINKLIALGCKENVKNACKADQTARRQKRIYLVDGDLELITDSNEKGLKHYYVQEKYCVENNLLHKSSIIEILHDHMSVDKVKIEKQLGFENWLKGLSRPLIELFLNYAICKKIKPTVQTVAFGVGKLCTEVKKVAILDENKVNARIDTIKTEILTEISEEEYNELIYDLRCKWPVSIETLITIVSAKDYLLPLLEFRFHKLKSVKMKRETLRLRLAKLCNVEELMELMIA
ncbi:hypothetical protein ASE92_17355 [Pedobacter sp. Leaf41]|uniref:DUF4435 domain-containing protein n=1 Tax=Pedobacter sp. Leaf41 TaxID=1736218 RepID=UPI0007035F12|nr:DUF4435 domain-containing protein [Pedobacter sp. Leaf41]KQN32373.1 hypothetical protein ASE92_17355 [Pedobacter sp. Leaf41]